MEFTFDEENGIIIDKATGERCVILPKARLEQILSRMTELFQSGAKVIIGEAFKAAGKWYVNEAHKNIKVDKTMFITSSVQRIVDAGVGRIEIVEFNPEKLELTFRIWNNIFAEIYQDHDTYCYGIEAYVTGIVEQLMGKTPQIQKTKCLGKGDAYCEWNITLPGLEKK